MKIQIVDVGIIGENIPSLELDCTVLFKSRLYNSYTYISRGMMPIEYERFIDCVMFCNHEKL